MVQGVLIEDGAIVDVNPATGEVVDRVPVTTESELRDAIGSAKASHIGWADVPLERRIVLLKEGCEAVGAIAEDLALKMTEEMGKPVAESTAEVYEAADKGAFLDLIRRANEDEILGGGGDGDGGKGPRSLVVRDPLGVVAVISPWNFPCGEIVLLALPALAAGNAVIVKPSEVAPVSGRMTVEALASVLPPGVLRCVQGDGTVGRLLAESDDVDMVAMTGSTATGKSIMQGCAPNLKRLVLELGGKDPMVVFGDADLDRAAADAVQHSLENAGQVCCSVERVYVDGSKKEEFERKAVEMAKTWKVGDGSDPENRVGPMVSTMQRDRVAAQVDAAVNCGAKVLYRSGVPPDAPEGTSFYPVTVLTDVTQDMPIQRAETFGPVLSIATFDGTEETAVRLANDTEYGLASLVYTQDMDRAGRVGRRIRSGQVGINCYSLTKADMACPWVGHKCSGFGFHSGVDGFRQFSVPKSIVFPEGLPKSSSSSSSSD